MEIRDWSKRPVKASAPRDLTESAQGAGSDEVAPLHNGAEVQRLLLSSNLPVVAQPSSSLSTDDSFSRMSSHDERSPQRFLHCGQFLSAGDRASIVEMWRAAARELDKHDLWSSRKDRQQQVTLLLRLGWRTLSSLVYHLWFMCAERSLHCL